MPLRRFALLTLLFAFLHGALTISSEVIVLGGGINLSHPEVHPPYTQRLFDILLNVLMQPASRVWDALQVTPKSSLPEWVAMTINSLTWGAAGAMIVILSSRRKRTYRQLS